MKNLKSKSNQELNNLSETIKQFNEMNELFNAKIQLNYNSYFEQMRKNLEAFEKSRYQLKMF